MDFVTEIVFMLMLVLVILGTKALAKQCWNIWRPRECHAWHSPQTRRIGYRASIGWNRLRG